MLAVEQKLHGLYTSPEKISILVVSPHHEDHNILRRMLHHADWSVSRAATVRETREELSVSNPTVVLCERDLPDGTWRDILLLVSELSSSPSVIVTSRSADETLWGDVLNAGGYDVLPKPFDRSEMMRVLGMAWRCASGLRHRRPVGSALNAF